MTMLFLVVHFHIPALLSFTLQPSNITYGTFNNLITQIVSQYIKAVYFTVHRTSVKAKRRFFAL